MNFVIFSYSFPPRNGAETFCSARFASALAYAGHDVHVVTMEHPWSIDRKIYDFLVHPAVKITRIPINDHTGLAWSPRILHRMRGREACDFSKCVKVLKRVLIQQKSPILISRSMPEVSNAVAWCCHKYARVWIAHFSDPYPWFVGNERSLKDRIFSTWGKSWGMRIIRDADIVSVTCETAKRFFRETYGETFNRKRTIITPHIGEPPLTTGRVWNRNREGINVAHAGLLNKARGTFQMLKAIKLLNESKGHPPFFFHQVGEVDIETQKYFDDAPDNAGIVSDRSPDTAMAVVAAADICFIPDLMTHLRYSPFLPSKFVYQIFSNTPIVIYTYEDSAMAQYARMFPKAGIVLADVNKENSLAMALNAASKMTKEEICREDIRELFTRKAISNIYSNLQF